MPKNNSNNSNNSNDSKNSQPPYSCSFASGAAGFFPLFPTPASNKKSGPKIPSVKNSHKAGDNSGLNQCVHGPFGPWL